jgi:CDP-diacylglycerol--glycerol-3-phosphate 3-phosphatidyltransferase
MGAFRMAALLITIGVAVTDWLDGKLAREMGLTTNLGKLLDPLADKIFVTSALVAFVEIDLVPAWAVIIVIAREFLVTGLRTIALEAGRVIAADRLGKHKTGWQLALIIGGIFLTGLRDFARPMFAGGQMPQAEAIFGYVTTGIIWFMLAVVLVLTILSGWHYVAGNKDLLVLEEDGDGPKGPR